MWASFVDKHALVNPLALPATHTTLVSPFALLLLEIFYLLILTHTTRHHIHLALLRGKLAFEDPVVTPPHEEEQISPRWKREKKKRKGELQDETVELLQQQEQGQERQKKQQAKDPQKPQFEQEEEEEEGSGLASLCDPCHHLKGSGAGKDENSCAVSDYGTAWITPTATTTTVRPLYAPVPSRPIQPIMPTQHTDDAHTPLLTVLPSASSLPTPTSTLAIQSPPLRPLRGLVFATNVLNNISLGCTAPFLQHHLETHYEQSYQSSGLVFAVFPLVALLCSPLGAVLCRAGRDKFLVWQLGLVTSVLASLGFGLAESVALLLLMRGLQGLGFALSTIAGLGLLIECSPDLTADIARQEVLVGLSMVLAPAAGGLLYTYAGFAAIFNILASGFMLLVLGLTAGRKLGYLGGREGEREGEEEGGPWWIMSSWPGSVSNWCWCSRGGAAEAQEGSRGEQEGREDEAATALLIPPENMAITKRESQQFPPCPSPPVSLLSMLLLPGVLSAALLVMVSFNSISFLELAFAGHAEAALGLAPLGTGLLFSCVDIAYAACAYLMARARKRGKEESEGGREEEEEDSLNCSRRGEDEQIGEEQQRKPSRSSSTSSTTSNSSCSSSSSSISSSSRFGFSFLNLRALALAGLACQALAMCLLGPLPLFSLPLPPFLPPSLLAWLSVACGCLVAGVGEALALVPAVDLMRAALPPSLFLATSDGNNSEQGATGHLAAVMSAATSLGECVGPLLGGLLMEVLPQRREVGCSGSGVAGEEGCVTGFRWTTASISVALAIAGCICYVGLANEGVGDEAAGSTPVAESVAAAAAAVAEEGSAGMGEGGERVYKPPTVAVPSPPHLQRRLSRPPTPISLASLRVPSTTSIAKPRTSSLSSSIEGSRRRSSTGGGGLLGSKTADTGHSSRLQSQVGKY